MGGPTTATAFCGPLGGRGLATRSARSAATTGGAPPPRPAAAVGHGRRARVAPAPGAAAAAASPRMDAAGTDFDDVARRLAEELGAPAGDADDKAGGAAASENVTVGPGKGGLMRVAMKHPASNQEVEVYTLGATVTTWKARGEDVLWVSKENKWDGAKPIRAGIPLCFPQFGPGPLAQHGFARLATWEVVFAGTLDDGSVQTVMTISSDTDNEVIRQWGHAFTAEYAVTVSPTGLETSLRVVNTGTAAFDFTAAFHNYFAVTNVAESRVFGVESLPFKDRLADGASGTEAADGGAGYLVDKAVDKLYVGAPEELAVFDFGALKVLKIKKSASLPDATVWNPFGEGGCDGGWKNFVCVEPAAAADKVVLEAGEEWLGAQLLGVE